MGGAWVELEWRRGFLLSARLPSRTHSCSAAELAQVLEALFSAECPAARFLSRLRLGPALAEGREGKPPRCEYASLVKILCAAPRGLRSLELGDFVFPDELALANVRLGSAALLGAKLPCLEELVLQGAGLSLRPLALPGLRRLALRLLRLERKQLAALLESRLEALEELELWIGEPKRRGAEPPLRVEELAPLLDRRRFPRLRTLRLLHCPFADQLASLCAQSSLAPGLHTLDLSHGTLGRAGDALEGLAACELAAGRFAEASEHCREAIAGFQRIGWPRGEGGALLSLGRVQHVSGDQLAAETSYRRGLELQREVGNGQLVARTLVWLAVLCAGDGRLEEAGAALEEAERTLEPSDAQGHEQLRLAAALLDCARARATRDPRAADRLLRAAREAVASPATSFEARGLGELVRAALIAAED
jgi:tetratricopeptide (TPR) repeat protein